MVIKYFVALLLSFPLLIYAQSELKAEAAKSHLSMRDFGLAYPLSSDWVQATDLVRNRIESETAPRTFDVLFAAFTFQSLTFPK